MTTQTIDYTSVTNPIIDSFRKEQLEKLGIQVDAMTELYKRLLVSGKVKENDK